MSKSRKISKAQHKDINRSERVKYLDTLMADMGIRSIEDIPSNEERQRWLRAATPSKIVLDKLKDMGYKVSSQRVSKRRSFKLKALSKIASLEAHFDDLNTAADKLVLLDISDDNFEDVAKAMRMTLFDQNYSPETQRAVLNSALQEYISGDQGSEYSSAINEYVYKASAYRAEADRQQTPAPVEPTQGQPAQLQADPSFEPLLINNRGPRVSALREKLVELGKLSGPGATGDLFDPEVFNALRAFQSEAGLSPSGAVDSITAQMLGLTGEAPSQTQEQPSPEGPAPETGGYRRIRPASGRVSFSGASDNMARYLRILDDEAEKAGVNITITSLARTSHDQARIMYNNFSRKRRSSGLPAAQSYLRRLYRRYSGIERIVGYFSTATSGSEAINSAKTIIDSWPRRGHLGGSSIDVRIGPGVEEVLMSTQSRATVDILRELRGKPGDHWHVSVKSLRPGGIAGIRSFNA